MQHVSRGRLQFPFWQFYSRSYRAIQYTYVNINGFNEQGSILPLQIHSDSQNSLRTDLGFQASYAWRAGNITIIPFLTAAWEHEYKCSNLPITVSAPLFGGATATFFGPAKATTARLSIRALEYKLPHV
ncbi:MAG: autotransporter outer membrane beta-barrel domain-containing protein [Verrucomicrobia bacterium]|nr:autotransporter outer membrane beta-barrel domain-containing protein [Verrucomicrobiota bacterium]